MDQPCIDHGRGRSLQPEGYALVGWPGRRSRCTGLHRLVYAARMHVQLDDLAGVVVRHTCDNPRCINPAHLIGGTKADNNRDRAERGRSATSVNARRALTAEQAEDIRSRYSPKRCRANGVAALAREFGVDRNVIYRVVRGEYKWRV